MVIDRLVEEIKRKKNPCIVGIDPEWSKLPDCYKSASVTEAVLNWAIDVIDAAADIVPAVKPQMAFFEVFGEEGVRVHRQIVHHAHSRGLLVVDDSKRSDIGNTARAYAFAHLAKDGPIDADFLTVSPFLGTDSMQPFVDTAAEEGKGVFVLVKTSNPGSVQISEAINNCGEKISDWLAGWVSCVGNACVGQSGYSSVGAVVGATFPEEARRLRAIMKNSFFLVPGYGAQGGGAADVVPCFNEDGLGALVSSSRGVIYRHHEKPEYDGSRAMYRDIVRQSAAEMRGAVYGALKAAYPAMTY